MLVIEISFLAWYLSFNQTNFLWSTALLKISVFPKVVGKFGSSSEYDVLVNKSNILGKRGLSGITLCQVIWLWHIFHKSNEESQ